MTAGPATTQQAAEAALDSARALLVRRPNLAGAAAELDDIGSGLRGRMRVAFVGRVSAGKSTLANALLAGSRAPTGAQELTYQVTRIRHGSPPALTIHYRDGRPPRVADVGSLARYVVRPDGASDDGAGSLIDHLEVTDPAPYLRSFDLIDTPGLDSALGADSANTLRFLDGPVDALVLVVSRGVAAREPDLLDDFRGHSLSPTPINAIAVLTKVEQLWHRRRAPDPMVEGLEIADQMMAVPAIRRVVHRVVPVASLAAAAAALATERDIADLRALSQVPAGALERWVTYEDTFTGEELRGTGVPPERRAALWSTFSRYGVVLACDVLRTGVDDATWRAGMDARTGMHAFRSLLVEHFGARARIVMLERAYARVQGLPTRFGAVAGPADAAALRAATKEFARQALTHLPRFRELELLRAHYAGRVALAAADAAELLRLIGEDGPDPRRCLGLPADAPAAEVRTRARQRLGHWRERQVGDQHGGETRDALRVFVRGYERLVEQVEDVRWEERP